MKLPRLSSTITPTFTRSTLERNLPFCALTAAPSSTATTTPTVSRRRTPCTATPRVTRDPFHAPFSAEARIDTRGRSGRRRYPARADMRKHESWRCRPRRRGHHGAKRGTPTGYTDPGRSEDLESGDLHHV